MLMDEMSPEDKHVSSQTHLGRRLAFPDVMSAPVDILNMVQTLSSCCVDLGEFLSDSLRGSCLEGMFFPCCAAQLAPCPFVPLSSYCACRRLAMDASCSIERLERMAKMCSWRSWLTSILLTI